MIESNLKSALNTDDRKTGKKGLKIKTWETYNFHDMPSVAAVTLLSKMQSDIRNSEADVIKLLKESIDVGALKFTSAEAIQIPNSSFVLRGDSFKADIFISAKDTTQDPVIYVGEYDSIGNGQYEMVGEYETVRVVNGKGLYSKKTLREGAYEWGGLISMKTETGTKTYPFSGNYLVANKTAIVSAVNMNVLYLKVDNPIEVSVPGFATVDVSPVISNGSISTKSKSTGEYTARPTKKGKVKIALYANVNGKRTMMGDMEFRVKQVPPPEASVSFTKLNSKTGDKEIEKLKMVAAGGIKADQGDDFLFKGLDFRVVSFKMTGRLKGDEVKELAKGPKFTAEMINLIKNTKIGNTISLSNIKAVRRNVENPEVRNLNDLNLVIK